MFKYDCFISYAHADNERYDAEQGWIDLLHERLTIRLHQLMGVAPAIWRDRKLQGNDEFGETLVNELKQAALLLSVLSPRYVQSAWCQREVREFYEHAQAHGGFRLEDKARVFKVLKTPVELGAQPEMLQGLLGYPFYEIDAASGRPREFSQHKEGASYDVRYWQKLDDLAWDLKLLLERIKAQTSTPPPPPGKTIYLAETTSDLIEERDCIKRELIQHGHRVVPDKPLPYNQQLRHEVENYLAEAQLTVHLIGARYGLVPEDESRSIIELQHAAAAARANQTDFIQLTWLPPGLSTSDERQQRFINELLNHTNLPKGAELLQNKLEDLKTIIHAKLNPPKLAKPVSETKLTTHRQTGNADPKLVYLVYDQPDYDAVAPVEDYLFQRGFEVISTPELNDAQAHRENLLLCDAVLTYCGATPDGWLQLKKMDLLKLPGYGRTKPLLAKGFYLGLPQTSGKERFRLQDGLVIKNYGEFAPDSLDPFIEQIERAEGAAL
jgi:hypothetical protein